MPSVHIKETDSTIYGLSNVTSDNIVYVPGSAITGPYDDAVLCGSYSEFINIFGDHAPVSPDGSVGTAWDYAACLLIIGLPVLFRRITKDATDTTLVARASADIKTTVASAEKTVGTVKELYGGTFGNSLNYSVVVNPTNIYFKVFKTVTSSGTAVNKLLESVKLIDKNADDSDAQVKAKLIAALGASYKTKYIEINVTDAENFKFDAVTNKALSGGRDADDLAVTKMIPSTYDILADKFVYDVKFITAGGYTNCSYQDGEVTKNIDITTNMVALAEKRGDAIAVLDLPIGTDKEQVSTYFSTSVDSSYAVAYAPWQYVTLDTNQEKWMPPSFVFLHTLAKSLKSGNKLWFPPAGVNRATVSEVIKPEYEIGGALLDEWQNQTAQFINPIMRIRQYGYVIYGQRTLYKNVDGSTDNRSALQELGVRITANEIKRMINNIAVSLTFEQNNIRTWNEFRGRLDPQLAQMKADGGVNDYEIIMDETTTSTQDINKNLIVGIVRVTIARAAEDFDIGFELTDASVTFTTDAEAYSVL